MDETAGLFSNSFMFVVILAGMASLIWMLVEQRRPVSWTTAVWLLPMLWMLIFYGALALQVDPIHNDPALRVALFRPGFFFFFVFVVLDKLNGRINLLIDSALRGVECFLASMRRKS